MFRVEPTPGDQLQIEVAEIDGPIGEGEIAFAASTNDDEGLLENVCLRRGSAVGAADSERKRLSATAGIEERLERFPERAHRLGDGQRRLPTAFSGNVSRRRDDQPRPGKRFRFECQQLPAIGSVISVHAAIIPYGRPRLQPQSSGTSENVCIRCPRVVLMAAATASDRDERALANRIIDRAQAEIDRLQSREKAAAPSWERSVLRRIA